MEIRALPPLLYMGILGLVSSPVFAADIFSDSFESQDMATTNSTGFKWASNNRTAIVTQDTSDGPVSVSVYDNKAIYSIFSPTMPDGSVRDWTAKSGTYSLSFRYPIGESWSQQNFNLGTPMKDIWIRYWIRIPTNFSFSSTNGNDKFIALWSDGYSQFGDSSSVWLHMWKASETQTSLAFSYSAGGYNSSGSVQQNAPFFTTADRGRWMLMVMHFKTESTPGASEGIIETYRLWSNETTFTKLHEITNAAIKIPAAGPYGFKAGYLLGWHQPYAVQTEWLIDDIVISDGSPIPYLLGQLPKPPTNLIIQ